jgi:hypothetical protein
MHKWFKQHSATQTNFVLTTDKEGKVKLGPLPKVAGLQVTDSTGTLSQAWMLGNQTGDASANLLTYPS